MSSLSSAYETALRGFVSGLMQAFAFKFLLERILAKYFELWNDLKRWDGVRATLSPWKERLNFLPSDLSKAKVFSITPRDFGFNSWLEKTPDSGFLESYIVRSHLLNGAVAHASEPAEFPNFMWTFSEDRTLERGLADWLREGPPSGWPTGEIAWRGHMAWARRLELTLDAVLEFIGVFRQVVWPK